jgi:hypothetical protein
MYIPLATNTWFNEVQTIIVVVSPQFGMNISILGDVINPCEGNVRTVSRRGSTFDGCIKCNNRVSVTMVDDI